MKILFCDKDIVVCIKPAGAVSTDEPGGMPERIREEIGEEQTVRTVHRLDSVVAGLMVYALSQEAASELSRQIADGTFVKEYMAVLEGEPTAEQGKLQDYLRRNPKERKTYAFDKPGKGAQEAELLYQLCSKKEAFSLVRVKLITGRTHQIRAQFSSRHLPLYGDRKYGAVHHDANLALWSCHLRFRHPMTGKQMDFSANPPSKLPWTYFDGYHEAYAEQDVAVEFKRSESFSDCRYAESCGGCAYQGLDYQKQLEKKQRLSGKWLRQYCSAEEIIGMEQPKQYKCKSVISFGINKTGASMAGVYVKSTRHVLRMDGCMVDAPKAWEIAETVRSLIEKYEIPVFDEKKKSGWLKQIVVRMSAESGEILLTIVSASDDFQSKKAFLKELCQAHPEITSVVLNLNSKEILSGFGKEERTIYGPGFITDRLCGNTFRITSRSLFPANPVQAEKLYDAAVKLAALTGTERVLDLGCGIGILGIMAAPMANKVLGVEAFRDTAEEAADNAKQNGISNLRIVCANPEEYLEALARSREQMDVVFLDSAHCRVTKKGTDALSRLKPKRIIWISGSTEFLAKDLEPLIRTGYHLQTVQPVDTAPYAAAVETVCLLARETAK